MKCVKCPGEMQRIRVGDIELERCADCQGTWFDGAELARVLEGEHLDALRTRTPARSDLDATRGRCPRCRSAGYLVRVAAPRGAFFIDTCPVCGGQWLDGGELDLLRPRGLLAGLRRLFERLPDYEG